jgi:hypothetical protein
MIRSKYELEHGDASRAIPRQYLSCTTAYEGFPGLASLAKRLSVHLGLDHGSPCLTKTESAPHFQVISSDIRLHCSANFPTTTSAGPPEQLKRDTFGLHCP